MVALATTEVLKRLRDVLQAKHGQDDVTATGSAIVASGSHVISATPQHVDKQ